MCVAKTRYCILGLALAAVFFTGCGQRTESGSEVFIVRIPPFADRDLTAGENHCYFYHWWHPPQNENLDVEKECKGAGLPNDGIPLELMLHDDRTLTLNREPNGSLTDPQPLIKRLSKIYDERREARVMVDGTDLVETSIGIRAPNSAKYGDVIKVIRVAKESGADPIILLLDGHLPEQLAFRSDDQ